MRQASRRFAIASFAIVWLTRALSAAETDGVDADEETASTELKTLTDPTIFKSRVWLDSEWNELKHDGGDGKVTLGGLWAWGLSPNQDWAVRLKLPVAWQVESAAGYEALRPVGGDAPILNKEYRTLADKGCIGEKSFEPNEKNRWISYFSTSEESADPSRRTRCMRFIFRTA